MKGGGNGERQKQVVATAIIIGIGATFRPTLGQPVLRSPSKSQLSNSFGLGESFP